MVICIVSWFLRGDGNCYFLSFIIIWYVFEWFIWRNRDIMYCVRWYNNRNLWSCVFVYLF